MTDYPFEKFLDQIKHLETMEFLGVATILGVELFEEKKETPTLLGAATQKAADAAGIDCAAAPSDTNKVPRPFEIVLTEMFEHYQKLNRNQRRNLFKLTKTATKKKR